MHGRVLFLLGDLLAENTPSRRVTSSKGGFRNFLGPLHEGDRYTAGGLISPGESDRELRHLMRKLARRIGRAGPELWSNSEALAPDAERWENPNLPSGYTYLLQFIAHDMVDSMCSATVEGARHGIANARNRPLALDAIYGSGPDEFPQAYEFDETHAENPTQIPRLKLRLGPTREAGTLSTFACPFRDIARGRTVPEEAVDGGNPDGKLREALVADPRNDDNFLVSQLTVVWHLFHNHVLCLLPAPEDLATTAFLNSDMARAYRQFYCARLAATLIYRNIIVQDVLPNILHPVVRDHYLSSGADGRHRRNFRINSNALQDNEEGIPLEFSHGAFRFGHVMVRDQYRVNSDTERELGRALKRTSLVQGRGDVFVSDLWLVDWARFFPLDLRDAPAPNKSRRIGPSYPDVLSRNATFFPPKEGGDPSSPDWHGLHNRELLSGSYAHMWSVPKLLDRMSGRLGSLAFGSEKPRERQPANAYDVWSERIREWLCSSRGQPGTEDFLTDRDIDRLVTDPPLLFFLLFEAAYVLRHGVPDAVGKPTGGAHLGPVGSIVVAETVCGVLTRHPVAFENSGPTLAKRLEECCFALLGSAHGQVLAGLAHIDTMPELIRYMIDKGVFGVSPPDAQHTAVLR